MSKLFRVSFKEDGSGLDLSTNVRCEAPKDAIKHVLGVCTVGKITKVSVRLGLSWIVVNEEDWGLYE